MREHHIKIFGRDAGDFVFGGIKYVVVVLFTFVCIYPFYYLVIYSISDPVLASQGVYFWPRGFNLDTYLQLLEGGGWAQAFLVSISRTVLGTAITVFFTTMLAFLMTRREMMGRKLVYRFIIITMYLSAGLVPWYLVMKAYGFQNSFLLYIIPGAINAYYMILIKTFIEQIPESMEESAEIEGAGFFTIFLRIIIPLSKPILATIAIYRAVAQWNSWQDNFFLVSKSSLQTVQLLLYKHLNETEKLMAMIRSGLNMEAGEGGIVIPPQTIRMAAVVITIVPIMMVYPFAQKYFTKGIMMGAVKG